MSVFVDTNVFLRSAQPSHPLHGVAVSTVASLIALGTSLTVTPQIMAEFSNVATRPVERNGLGFPHVPIFARRAIQPLGLGRRRAYL